MFDRADFNPFGPRRRRSLHEEKIARCPIRISFHHHGPIAEVRQEYWRNIGVILQQIALGNSKIGPERFLQIGQFDLLVAELELNFVMVAGQINLRDAFNSIDAFLLGRPGGWPTAPGG